VTSHTYIRGRPRGLDAGDDWYPEEHRTIDVLVEDGDRPVDTGLVDVHGVAIYRVKVREKVGF